MPPIGSKYPRRDHAFRSGGFCEALEPRALLSAIPEGPGFVVNTLTAGEQVDASVAAAGNGAFVVAWKRGDPAAG